MGNHPASEDINSEASSSRTGVRRGANNPILQTRKFLRSLQEIQLDFVEEVKALVGLWSQGKKKEEYPYWSLRAILISVVFILSPNQLTSV
jgi:hypothetical protein